MTEYVVQDEVSGLFLYMGVTSNGVKPTLYFKLVRNIREATICNPDWNFKALIKGRLVGFHRTNLQMKRITRTVLLQQGNVC